MAVIKIAEPGSSHTMTIAKVEDDRSGSWPDWKFSDGRDTLSVPQKAMERQLTRLQVQTAFDLVGSTVKFSRSTELGKNGKPFYNADLVNAREAAPSKRIPPPEVAPPRQPAQAGFGGARIPDLDGPEEVPAHHRNVPDAPDPWEEQPYRAEEPKRTAREDAETLTVVQKRQAFLKFYASVYCALAGMLPTEDAQAIQAATATCVIAMDKKGLLP